MRAYLQELGVDVQTIVQGGYQYPTCIPTNDAGKKQYEINAKDVNAILGSLAESEFVQVMQLNTAKVIWDNLVQSYEEDTKVKSAKLQTFRIEKVLKNV